MSNRKIAAGILTAIAAGITISLVLSSKKGRSAGKKLLRRGSSLTEELKGKFNDFVDQVQSRVQGVVK